MSPAIRIIAILTVLSLVGYAGHKVTQNHYLVTIAKMEKDQADAKAAIEKDNADKLRAAQALSDVLSNSLANAEAQNNQTTLEKTREIPRYATGATCFNAELTRLLNTPNIDLAAQNQAISEPATESAAAAATQSEQGEALTDTDLAEWIANAQRLYETCRGRLSALIDFEHQIDVPQQHIEKGTQQ